MCVCACVCRVYMYVCWYLYHVLYDRAFSLISCIQITLFTVGFNRLYSALIGGGHLLRNARIGHVMRSRSNTHVTYIWVTCARIDAITWALSRCGRSGYVTEVSHTMFACVG